MTSNPPWTIDIMDKLEEEFYDQFENEMNEAIFMFLTETPGRQKRTIAEAADEIVATVHGEKLEDIVNEEAMHDYDYYFVQSQQLASEIMHRVMRRFCDEY